MDLGVAGLTETHEVVPCVSAAFGNRQDKAQSETIKQNFVEYLIAHARERQVIIVEQSKRMPFVPSESEKDGVHVIQFSRNRQEGRYGFLNEVYNPEDR